MRCIELSGLRLLAAGDAGRGCAAVLRSLHASHPGHITVHSAHRSVH